MFVYNLKVNSNNLFKVSFIIIIIIAVLILSISIYKFLFKEDFTIGDELPKNDVSSIKSNQYTNILKQVYENVDSHVGQTINFTGYVYKLYDFKDTEFILARDMLINSDSQSVVVGFLCTYSNAKDLKEGTWVNITGTIIKGYYHNAIPVLNITKIEEVQKPEDAFVYPPDNTYIPTSAIL